MADPQRVGNDVPVLRGGEVSRAISRLITRGELACIAVVIFSIVQLTRFGTRYDHIWLLGVAVVSALALFGYPLLALGKGSRSALRGMMALAGLVPYAMGCYLVFYRGLWALTEGLSLFAVFRSIVYVLVGYQVVSSTYKATEFVKAVDEGRIRVE